MQIIALLLAFVSVSFLAMGLGYVPYISLILGVTFGIYGLIKTKVKRNGIFLQFWEKKKKLYKKKNYLQVGKYRER